MEAAFESYLKGTDGVRVVSMNEEGKITGEMRADEANENNLGLLMMGGTDTGKDGEAAV